MRTRPLYQSPNGDSWLLAVDDATGAVSVVHRPNAASGGRESATGVEAFLERGGGGPEHAALRELVDDVRRELAAGKMPAVRDPVAGDR